MTASTGNTSLSGKLALVTGANSGIGKEIARSLAAQGAELILACRNLSKGEAAAKEISAGLADAKISVLPLDLALLSSVRAFAGEFLSRFKKLDILVNNAGAWGTTHETSADNLELTWATNVVGPELLTQLLLPALKAAGKARIVNLSSTVASGLDLDDIEFKKRSFSGMTAYTQTKQANRMLSWALAERLAGTGITVNAMSPGLVRTQLNRNAGGILGMIFSVMVPLFGKSPSKGADTAVWLASSPDLEGISGKFWENRKERVCEFRDNKEGIRRLETLCHTMAGLKA